MRKGAAQAFILHGMHRDVVQKVGGWRCRLSLLHYEDQVMLNPQVQAVRCPLRSVQLIEEAQEQQKQLP